MVRSPALTFFLLSWTTLAQGTGPALLLVGNTRADNVVSIDLTGDTMEVEEVAAIPNPDHFVEYQGNLYTSSGDDLENSAIVLWGGLGPEVFAAGGGLKRPYGFAFADGILFVSSFMTDQILMYDADSGEFMGVFASSEDGLCNGPNHIAIHEGSLYLTTQGSNVINGTLQYLFESQVVVYNMTTQEGTVFAVPEAVEGGLGFVSMLACTVYCSEECMLLTSDFAGGLRMFSLTNSSLIYSVGTSYAPGASTGSLAIDSVNNHVYVAGFVNETTPGVVMRYDVMTGDSMPAEGQDGALFFQGEALVRPIGLFVVYSNEDKQGIVTMSRATNFLSASSLPLCFTILASLMIYLV